MGTGTPFYESTGSIGRESYFHRLLLVQTLRRIWYRTVEDLGVKVVANFFLSGSSTLPQTLQLVHSTYT